MSEVIEIRIVPIRKLWYSEEYNSGIYACKTDEADKVELDKKFKSFVIKGNTVELAINNEYNAKLEKMVDKERGVYYAIKGIYQDIPKSRDKQMAFLKTIVDEGKVESIFKAYEDDDIIRLIMNDELDYNIIHGVGAKSLEKIKNKVVENFEFQEAFDFLKKYDVTDNLIIKLVKHFTSAGLLIEKIKENPYSITEVHGVGFKKADEIALAIGFNPRSPHRIKSAIEYVVEEEAGNGHTYVNIGKVIDTVVELTLLDDDLIEIYETDKIKVVDDKVTIKKLYSGEKYIAKRIKEMLTNSNELNFDPDIFISKMEKKFSITLTDQQKGFFRNIKRYSFNVLSGFAGCGKSMLQKLLIELLDELNIGYKLLAPTGKAAKVLGGYTNRDVETIHRAIGLGLQKDKEAQKVIKSEFVIVDETSMMDVSLCAKLMYKCINENLRILFIGDPAQIPSVSAGNVLHDLIESKIVPVTEVNIVFRQSEGGILDIATKVRQGEKFLNNDNWGIFNFGNNCIVVCVPKEKMEKGYQYYYKQFVEKYSTDDITIVTPTKKSSDKLGTIEVNRNIQGIVNASADSKNEIVYGFDKVIFREGDYVINTSNTYDIKDTWGIEQDIVNGDMGIIEGINKETEEIIVNFGMFKIPFERKHLKQLLHAWCLTKHKMQGSAAKVIIALADKSHKFQLNANLLYTAFTRPEEQLVIISQAETINFALKKFANLQRNTFLKDMLKG